MCDKNLPNVIFVKCRSNILYRTEYLLCGPTTYIERDCMMRLPNDIVVANPKGTANQVMPPARKPQTALFGLVATALCQYALKQLFISFPNPIQ